MNIKRKKDFFFFVVDLHLPNVEQPQQGSPDVPLSSHFQLIRGNLKRSQASQEIPLQRVLPRGSGVSMYTGTCLGGILSM